LARPLRLAVGSAGRGKIGYFLLFVNDYRAAGA
jgi:hypothetical protein